ncbi:glycoside hydrolase family 43 protein [Maribacter confluentis]|uniref:Glycoside hydrolase family 43 protein n=1 Tax=Maribacter confluentis TaxID=1656093 RepID=A0ABT8RNY2_9FLAO|nr:glycoside hydrolase family 43 protein [Maribacter confluentis]MDO1512172.1 glycoside hydrolase family 43 protein [Maribacter confluentis]
MNQLIKRIVLLFFIGNLGFSQNVVEHNSSNPFLADPTIFLSNGTYYLYGTTGDPKLGKDQGFLVYTSNDLKVWKGPIGAQNGLALKKGDAFGDTGFWAPQIFEYQDKFYMAYTANEHIAMATADNPLGPFKNAAKSDLEAPVRQIDPFVFFDTDGKKYLYHVRLTEGNRIFVAELEDDLMAIKPETLTECIAAEKEWENTQNVEWPVSEGPTVLKHGELYYMMYSANDFRNPDYAVGFATSKSPLGPWKKSDKSPIIHKDMLGVNGTGHGDVFIDKHGEMQYVLHTHYNNTKVSPRRTAIIKMDFKKHGNGPEVLEVKKESFRLLKQ